MPEIATTRPELAEPTKHEKLIKPDFGIDEVY